MFGEKNTGKRKMYIFIAVMPKLYCPVFHFHQICYSVTNTFCKNNLIRNSKLVKDD